MDGAANVESAFLIKLDVHRFSNRLFFGTEIHIWLFHVNVVGNGVIIQDMNDRSAFDCDLIGIHAALNHRSESGRRLVDL